MDKIRTTILSLVVGWLCFPVANGQSTIPATGGNAGGTGGTVSYTIGQIVYSTPGGTAGTVAQGVQQPCEISVVTALENMNEITLEYKIFPNPTKGLLTLTIKPFDSDNFSISLFDMNGVVLKEIKIDSEVNEISMDNFYPSVYFLKIIRDALEVKVFKIIKN